MGGYTKANLRNEVENAAPKHGMPSELESRFARSALGGEIFFWLRRLPAEAETARFRFLKTASDA